MKTTPTRVYLTSADQHRLLNEPLSSDYPAYPQWVHAAVWIPIIFGFITGVGGIGYGL